MACTCPCSLEAALRATFPGSDAFEICQKSDPSDVLFTSSSARRALVPRAGIQTGKIQFCIACEAGIEKIVLLVDAFHQERMYGVDELITDFFIIGTVHIAVHKNPPS